MNAMPFVPLVGHDFLQLDHAFVDLPFGVVGNTAQAMTAEIASEYS
jgi:hypothetical protein